MIDVSWYFHCWFWLGVWLGGRVVRTLDLLSTGRGFESQPPCCRVQPWARCKHTCASVTKQYNLVPVNERWCLAAGKITVGLASHWPRITDISGSPPTGSRPRRGRWAPAYALLVEYDELCLFLCWHCTANVEHSAVRGNACWCDKIVSGRICHWCPNYGHSSEMKRRAASMRCKYCESI